MELWTRTTPGAEGVKALVKLIASGASVISFAPELRTASNSAKGAVFGLAGAYARGSAQADKYMDK